MELQTIGWMLVAWFGLSLVVGLALGWFLREVNASADESELDQVLSNRRVVRYMRGKADRDAVAVDNKATEPKARRGAR